MGEIHPDYLLPRLTSRQLAGWMAWFKRHPFGQDISDSVVATQTAALVNRWRGKGEKAHEPGEYLPDFKTPVEQSPEHMKHALRGILGGLHGNRKNDRRSTES